MLSLRPVVVFAFVLLILLLIYLIIMLSVMFNKVSRLCLITKNPFNIRFNSSNQWLGAIKDKNYKGFACFVDRLYGLRAGFILLNNYRKRGLSSVSSIVYRFAPPQENNTKAYIDFVSAALVEHGFDDNCLSWSTDMVFVMAQRMLKLECGFDLCREEFDYIIKRFDIVYND